MAMSIRKSLSLTLLTVTLTMVIGYSWLMEANLVSGVLFSSEIRLHRAADAWIKSQSEQSTVNAAALQRQPTESTMPPADGSPVVYAHRESLPATVQAQLPKELSDGQFTVVEIDKVGLLNIGYLLHLFRTSPGGDDLHVVQQLVLAEYEEERVQALDALVNQRALLPAAVFILANVLVVLVFGRFVARATTRLVAWCDSLSIRALPDKPPKLPFLEMQHIAAGTLAAVQREQEAVEHRHRFLRFASHELRTPLAIASANTELLARHGVDAKARVALARLEESLKNMSSLTNTLLWLGRGEVPLPDPEPVDLLCLVNNIIEENRSLAISNGVTVEVCERSLKPVLQPRVLLVILCSNLISNAIRYTRDGRVVIRIGPGTIEIENCGKQLGNEAGAGGHGLGLQLVEWVVERANWRWTEEEGETFRRHHINYRGGSCSSTT